VIGSVGKQVLFFLLYGLHMSCGFLLPYIYLLYKSPLVLFLTYGFIHVILYVYASHSICRTHVLHMPHVLTPFGARVCGIWSEAHSCTTYSLIVYSYKSKDVVLFLWIYK